MQKYEIIAHPELWEKTPISQEPELEGRYLVFDGYGWIEVSYNKEYGFYDEICNLSDVTHWLKPVKQSDECPHPYRECVLSENGLECKVCGYVIDKMNELRVGLSSKEVDVDIEIAELVQALNDAGVETVASCCGHGFQPIRISLKGAELFITTYDQAQEISNLFPGINGEPADKGQPPEDAQVSKRIELLGQITQEGQKNGLYSTGDSRKEDDFVKNIRKEFWQISLGVCGEPGTEFSKYVVSKSKKAIEYIDQYLKSKQ